MASFDAGNVVESLDYDFTAMAKAPHSIKGLAAVKGTIREPTDTQIHEFTRALIAHELRARKLDPGEALPKDATYDQRLEAASKFSEALEAQGLDKAEAEIFSALCSGKPSAAHILLLPRRIRNPFFTWLRDELNNPEAAAGDGNGQVLTLPSAAAG